jgi:hypothetical protein
MLHQPGKKDIEGQAEEIKSSLYIERLKDYYNYGLYLRRGEEGVLRDMKIKDLLRLCFTEIRLSQAEDHSKRYGKLGVGFSREFILKRSGRPVIYTPYIPEDGLLEKSLRQAYKKSSELDEIHRPLKYVLAYIKRMSDKHDEPYYDEMEWRIVYDEDSSNQYFKKGKEDGVYRFLFDARDLKVLIFPDEKTKLLSLADKELQINFYQHLPIIVTLDECKSF